MYVQAQRGKGTPRRAGAVSAAVAPTASPATTVSPTPPLQGSTSGLFVHVNPSTHAGDSTAQPQLQQVFTLALTQPRTPLAGVSAARDHLIESDAT